MKTPMQELIELIEKGETRLDLIENHKQIWLEKEKEHLKTAFESGWNWNFSSEKYYNETYNENK